MGSVRIWRRPRGAQARMLFRSTCRALARLHLLPGQAQRPFSSARNTLPAHATACSRNVPACAPGRLPRALTRYPCYSWCPRSALVCSRRLPPCAAASSTSMRGLRRSTRACPFPPDPKTRSCRGRAAFTFTCGIWRQHTVRTPCRPHADLRSQPRLRGAGWMQGVVPEMTEAMGV